MGQADVFRDMVPMPLPELFTKWYGPIPPIKETRDQTGDWDTVGQSRTVVLVGGGSMREELTQFDAPNSFGYTLSGGEGSAVAVGRPRRGRVASSSRSATAPP